MPYSVATRPKSRSSGWVYSKPASLRNCGLRVWKRLFVPVRSLFQKTLKSPPVGSSCDTPTLAICWSKAEASSCEPVGDVRSRARAKASARKS